MKNFGRILTLAALCAVILGSCIKEQAYKLETAQLMVNISRAGASESQTQGDGIGDAMVWAFKCNLDSNGVPSNVENTATGWRRQSNIDTYQSITLHVELPICEGTQDYLLVAVLNTDAFGKLSNNTLDAITLDADTKYSELSTMVFNAERAAFWKSYPRDLEPERMPISNWKTFRIKSTNTHPTNCYKLVLPVYRAVGKVQLMMNKTSADFDVTVTGAKIVSSAMPQNGGVFTAHPSFGTGANDEPTMQGLSDSSIEKPDWMGTVSFAAGERAMYNTTTDGAVSFTSTEIADTDVSTGADSDTYTWIGSAFLYENKGELENASEYDTVPTGDDGGYYMQVEYTVDVNGVTEKLTKYVALPPVVRNHDIQVKATVAQTITGDLEIYYYVTEWTKQEIDVPPFN